ncbi:hypothetical protein TRIP_B250051 [uncultured Desulfatiglans sp.]|uniref:Response regulatory domain-containing protein n=1 Tax=Uncultured Desulfatiglans sp. TaxID=1748965 RepID=A0A653A4K0_UNCDX|nr:hypothetical protein TRIP_B250051 [uncultured Desulfatiglans sp.]
MTNIKEIKRLCGGDLVVAAQANVQIDIEIGQKDHFRMETVILDSNLPLMNGLEVLTEFQSIPFQKMKPVIVPNPHRDHTDIETGRTASAPNFS